MTLQSLLDRLMSGEQNITVGDVVISTINAGLDYSGQPRLGLCIWRNGVQMASPNAMLCHNNDTAWHLETALADAGIVLPASEKEGNVTTVWIDQAIRDYEGCISANRPRWSNETLDETRATLTNLRTQKAAIDAGLQYPDCCDIKSCQDFLANKVEKGIVGRSLAGAAKRLPDD